MFTPWAHPETQSPWPGSPQIEVGWRTTLHHLTIRDAHPKNNKRLGKNKKWKWSTWRSLLSRWEKTRPNLFRQKKTLWDSPKLGSRKSISILETTDTLPHCTGLFPAFRSACCSSVSPWGKCWENPHFWPLVDHSDCDKAWGYHYETPEIIINNYYLDCYEFSINFNLVWWPSVYPLWTSPTVSPPSQGLCVFHGHGLPSSKDAPRLPKQHLSAGGASDSGDLWQRNHVQCVSPTSIWKKCGREPTDSQVELKLGFRVSFSRPAIRSWSKLKGTPNSTPYRSPCLGEIVLGASLKNPLKGGLRAGRHTIWLVWLVLICRIHQNVKFHEKNGDKPFYITGYPNSKVILSWILTCSPAGLMRNRATWRADDFQTLKTTPFAAQVHLYV